MNYFILTLNDRDIKLKLTSKDCLEIESKTKIKLIDFIQDYSITTVITLLRYMLRAEKTNASQDDACNLYDELVDSGYTLEEIIFKVIYEVCVVSGFLKRSDLDEMLNFKEENQATLKEKKKQEILQA